MVRTAEGKEFEPQSDVLLKALVGMISATRMSENCLPKK